MARVPTASRLGTDHDRAKTARDQGLSSLQIHSTGRCCFIPESIQRLDHWGFLFVDREQATFPVASLSWINVIAYQTTLYLRNSGASAVSAFAGNDGILYFVINWKFRENLFQFVLLCLLCLLFNFSKLLRFFVCKLAQDYAEIFI